MKPILIKIDPEEAGRRLDQVLAGRDLGVSRSALQRWFDAGRIRMRGTVVDKGDRAIANAEVHVEPEAPPPSEAEPESMTLAVLFEDDHVIIIDKPAGLVMHPAPGNWSGTLVNGLLFHAAIQTGVDDRKRPGIVHRLDKDTSGVVVVAKTEIAKARLVEQFQAHTIERAYLAIVQGLHPKEFTYSTMHGRDPVNRKKFSCSVRTGKRAVTHVKTVQQFSQATLLRCRLETGRTHQIRVHLSAHGYPLLGDKLYGSPPRDHDLRGIGETLGRQALHASVLGFKHPTTDTWLKFESPIPEDFQTALDHL